MTCPKCQTQNSEGAKFCANCGTNLESLASVAPSQTPSPIQPVKKSKGNTKIALLHIDCDLYESTRTVLKDISDLFQDGTVMLCDDYWSFRGRKDKGEQLALREAFECNDAFTYTSWFQYGWHGQAFIINKKNLKE